MTPINAPGWQGDPLAPLAAALIIRAFNSHAIASGLDPDDDNRLLATYGATVRPLAEALRDLVRAEIAAAREEPLG